MRLRLFKKIKLKFQDSSTECSFGEKIELKHEYGQVSKSNYHYYLQTEEGKFLVLVRGHPFNSYKQSQ